ncbi:MAG TPA: ferredoxin reductase family protein [Steroidobacteraceae bacterium]|nr:ferredoxin reductase family protein [Steroidobacteraceae bacterium]
MADDFVGVSARRARPPSPWQVVLLLVLITSALVLAEIPRDTWFTTAAASLALGASALALMGAAALLGGRWPLFESLLGGLDRVYLVHKWLAVWALAFASFHLVFQAELRTWDLAPIVELPRYTTRLVRQASFVALMVIVVLALNRRIPYSQWRWWHKLSGPLFLVVIAHWLSIRSPVRIDSPAGIWLAAITGLGICAALYKLVLYPFIARHAVFRVVATEAGPAALRLELEPVRRGITFEPGQFGFLRMKADGLREPHPFTIASAGEGGRVHFVIRSLGDYTSELVRRVAPGMQAEIHAPYGRFTRHAGAAREIWIAGGVGISPFLAWLTDPDAVGLERVTLFYFHTPGRAFPAVDELGRLARSRGVELVAVSSGPAAPEFCARLSELAGGVDATSVAVSFCGPEGLLAAVQEQLRKCGIPPSAVQFEHFNFR